MWNTPVGAPVGVLRDSPGSSEWSGSLWNSECCVTHLARGTDHRLAAASGRGHSGTASAVLLTWLEELIIGWQQREVGVTLEQRVLCYSPGSRNWSSAGSSERSGSLWNSECCVTHLARGTGHRLAAARGRGHSGTASAVWLTWLEELIIGWQQREVGVTLEQRVLCDSPGSRNWTSAGSSERSGSLWNSECCVTHLARGTDHRLAAARGRGHSGTASAVWLTWLEELNIGWQQREVGVTLEQRVLCDSPGSRNWSSAGSSERSGSLWNSECCVTHLARGTEHRLAAARGRGHSGTASAVWLTWLEELIIGWQQREVGVTLEQWVLCDSPGSRNWTSAGSSEWAGSLWNSECCVTHLARGTDHRLAAARGRGHSGTASAVLLTWLEELVVSYQQRGVGVTLEERVLLAGRGSQRRRESQVGSVVVERSRRGARTRR